MMRVIFILVFYILCVTFTLEAASKYYDDDEGKPYEFGFTIDGEQHRHEKKDVNGIIQGEFGFITADGIYHVTVYATDENGNFRILSMRNVRISAPLDGSGTPEQKSFSKSTDVGPPANQQVAVTTPKPPYRFTTQSTIKPACGGCGYVTTAKTPPGSKFPFQTPLFRSNNEDVPLPQQQQPVQTPVGPPQGIFNRQGPTGGAPVLNEEYNNVNPPSGGGENVPEAPGSDHSPPAPPPVEFKPVYPQETPTYDANPVSKQEDAPRRQGKQLLPGQGFVESQFQSENPYSSNGPTPFDENPENAPRSPLSDVRVTDGVIKVPGNPDIPIKDKYPGMADGLPKGIEENDITDLLYKFNYTVGFHGHYEKGYKNGAKIGGYFVNGRDGLSRVVTYVADENGFRPKFKLIRLGLDSPDTPKEDTEKSFGLKYFEFEWYSVT